MKIIVLLTFLLDQGCKHWINRNLADGEQRDILCGKLYITNLKNKGMAMGILAEQRCFIYITSITAIYNIFHLWGRTKGSEKFGLAVMAGGGISNVLDRFTKGEVTDYIYFKSRGRTPVFNLADVFAVLGMFIILVPRLLRKNG